MIASPTSSRPPAFQFKASRQPMVWAAGAYSLGIVAGVYAWRPAVWWLIAVAAFGAAAAYFGSCRSGVAWLLTLGTFFLAGAFHIQMRSASPRLDTGILPYADRREIQITAHVTRQGRIQPGGFGELRQTLDLEGEQVQTPDGPIVPVHSGIRVNIYSPRANEDVPADLALTSPLTQTFHYGDRIRFLAKLRPPRNFRNPVPSTTRDTWQIVALQLWARRRSRRWNYSPDSPAAASNVYAIECTRASLPKLTNFGLRARRP